MDDDQMSLLEMSPNVQKTASLKRSHDEFSGDDVVKAVHEGNVNSAPTSTDLLPPSSTNDVTQRSPCLSPGLTDGGSSTPARQSPSPLTPSKDAVLQTQSNNTANSSTSPATTQGGANGPAPKRKRLTAEEKERREKEEAEKKRDREEKQKQKAEEKAKAEKEKAVRAAEREEKRKKKEEEDRVKAQQRDEKKQQKEEEAKRKQEAEEKKAKSQPSLKSFFGAPRPAKETSAGTHSSPKKATPLSTETKTAISEYGRMFQPFYIKEHTRMAPPANQMDEETREVKSQILDEFISGKRTHDLSPFDPVKVLELPSRPPRRGRVHEPVRHIMESTYKAMETAQNRGAGEADNIMRDARSKLAKIPMKVIAFSRDVRPPYYGTATYKPFQLGRPNLKALAQQPVGRNLELDYDYDSEAEWQEDEGEDVDVDDDEEELDDEDDMDGFLDDSEDAGLARRIFANTLEPECTGICFEGFQPLEPILQEHKMEYIHELLGGDKAIDPWSTAYWEPEPKKTVITKAIPQTEPAAKMAPPPAPANAFAALSKPAAAPADGLKMVKNDILDDVKRAILANKLLSKVGMVDVVYQQFRDRSSRAEVKNTIEVVAEKKKGANKLKEWELKPGHEIKL